MNKKRKLEKFLESEITGISNLSILKLDKDSYILFGKYTINKQNDTYSVKYIYYTEEKVFSSLKSAVAWCVYHERGKITECIDIEHLDFKISSLTIDISQLLHVVGKAKDKETRYIYTTKLEECILKKQHSISVINRYINLAGSWQSERMNSATKR